MGDKKYASAGKPPLPPVPDNIAATVRSNDFIITSSATAFIHVLQKEYKVKGEWSHENNKYLARLVLMKLRSTTRQPKKPHPVPKGFNFVSVNNIANIFATNVLIMFKESGQWSDDYNHHLIQLALLKLRSGPPNKPLAVAHKPFKKHVAHKPSNKPVAVADKPVAVDVDDGTPSPSPSPSPSKKLKGS